MRNAQIAIKRKLVARAGHRTKERCDRGLVERAHRGVHRVQLGEPAVYVIDAVAGALLEILSRGERAVAGPGNDNRAHRRIAVDRRERKRQLAPDVGVDCVQPLRPVQPDDRYFARALRSDRRHVISRSSARP